MLSNPLEEFISSADRRIREVTPEPTPVDESLVQPILQNPTVVNDAIQSLANSRLEGVAAAEELGKRTFGQQMEALLLSQVLGAGGAASQAFSGIPTNNGLRQRNNTALPQAFGLQDRLTSELIQHAQNRGNIEGETGLRVAQNTEQSRVANEQEIRNQKIQLQNLISAAEKTAREKGESVLDVAKQMFDSNQDLQRTNIAASNAASTQVQAEAALIRARQARITSNSGKTPKKPGDLGFVAKSLTDLRNGRAQKSVLDQQIRELSSNPDLDPTGELLDNLSSQRLKLDQGEATLLGNATEAFRRAQTDEVYTELAQAIVGQDPTDLDLIYTEIERRRDAGDSSFRAWTPDKIEAFKRLPPDVQFSTLLPE